MPKALGLNMQHRGHEPDKLNKKLKLKKNPLVDLDLFKRKGHIYYFYRVSYKQTLKYLLASH